MKTAISLFKGGYYDADTIYRTMMNSLRMACPECLERVKLINRSGSKHFAHHAVKPYSPLCMLRTKHHGNSDYTSGRQAVRRIFKKNLFQSELKKMFKIVSLPSSESPYINIIKKLVSTMQEARKVKGRCVLISDLPNPPISYSRMWTTTEKLVRAYVPVLSTHCAHLSSKYQVLNSEVHIITVLLLWEHLHLSQTVEDLIFLLLLT